MNTRQKRTNVSGPKKTSQAPKKARKEKEYEVEYILATQRHPDENKKFPDNVTEALVKWVGYKIPTTTTNFDGCINALWNCVERENYIEAFVEAQKKQLKKLRNEAIRRMPASTSKSTGKLDESQFDFDSLFPEYKNRNEFFGKKNDYKIRARTKEEQWNKKLEEIGAAPVYIENWINKVAVQSFEFLTEPRISDEVENIRDELRTVGLRNKKKLDHCVCQGKCDSSCSCMSFQDYKRKKIILNEDGMLEKKMLKNNFYNNMMLCGSDCSCNDDCPYKQRLVREDPVVIFYTGTKKGYGSFSCSPIPAGSYIGTYTGLIRLARKSESREVSYDYDVVTTEAEEYLENLEKKKSKGPNKKRKAAIPSLICDAWKHGNETRFFNNCCGSKSTVVPVNAWKCDNEAFYFVTFFSKNDIRTGTELTIEYSQQKVKNGMKCQCSADCPNFM